MLVVGQKHKRFRGSPTPFPLRDIRKNPRSMYARVSKVMAQFVLKIEKLSHIMGPTPILKMARAYGLRPQLWLLVSANNIHHSIIDHSVRSLSLRLTAALLIRPPRYYGHFILALRKSLICQFLI